MEGRSKPYVRSNINWFAIISLTCIRVLSCVRNMNSIVFLCCSHKAVSASRLPGCWVIMYLGEVAMFLTREEWVTLWWECGVYYFIYHIMKGILNCLTARIRHDAFSIWNCEIVCPRYWPDATLWRCVVGPSIGIWLVGYQNLCSFIGSGAAYWSPDCACISVQLTRLGRCWIVRLRDSGNRNWEVESGENRQGRIWVSWWWP